METCFTPACLPGQLKLKELDQPKNVKWTWALTERGHLLTNASNVLITKVTSITEQFPA